MKRFFYISKLLVCLVFLSSSHLFAQFELGEYRFRPQIGLWFGPVTPVPGTKISEILKTSLGGGIFLRFNLPSDDIRSEIGSSISSYDSGEGSTESLLSVPTYAAITYSLPFDLPLLFQIKLGAGLNYFKNQPEKTENTHPAIYSGFEMSFPAGNIVNIGLRVDYHFAIESYVDPPPENPNFEIVNGHFINVGLMLNFNLNPN